MPPLHSSHASHSLRPGARVRRAGPGMSEHVAAAWRGVQAWLAALERQPALARRVVVGAWAVTRGLLLLGLLIGHSYSDPAFYNYAGQLAAGRWPYHDVPVEYPPLAMLLILLPALPLLPFAGIAPRPDPAFVPHPTHLPQPDPVRYGAYGISFALLMLLIDALTLVLVLRAARRLAPGDPLGMRSGLLYIGLVFASSALLQKFDLATGTLSLAAVLALAEKRHALAGAALALATLLKGFPALALPIFLVYILAGAQVADLRTAVRERGRQAARCAVGFAAVLGGVALAVMLWAGVAPLWHAVTYHTERGTEIESIYGNLLLLLGWVPGLRPTTTFNGDDLSRVVRSPLNAAMGAVAVLALAGAVALVYMLVWHALLGRGRDRRAANERLRITLVATLAALLAFEVTFRALPAHYLLVAAPLGVVVRLSEPRLQRWWLAGLFGIALVGQAVIAAWHALLDFQPWAVALLTLRNCSWALALAALFAALWRRAPNGAASGRMRSVGDGVQAKRNRA